MAAQQGQLIGERYRLEERLSLGDRALQVRNGLGQALDLEAREHIGLALADWNWRNWWRLFSCIPYVQCWKPNGVFGTG